MSCQCGKCLKWLRETSYGFIDGFACDKCQWEAPLELVDYGLIAYPREGYEDWARQYYYMQRMYEAHLVDDTEEDPGWRKIEPCEQMKESGFGKSGCLNQPDEHEKKVKPNE